MQGPASVLELAFLTGVLSPGALATTKTARYPPSRTTLNDLISLGQFS